MDFALTEDQQSIRDAVLKHCARFPDDYWLERDRDGVFPRDFHQSMAEAGWLGLAMPEAVGGAGLGITEAAIMMTAVAESGGGMAAASSIHGPVFSLQPVALFGTEEQHQANDPARAQRRGSDLLRGHRAQRRPRHDQAQDPRGASATAATWSTGRRSGSRSPARRTR